MKKQSSSQVLKLHLKKFFLCNHSYYNIAINQEAFRTQRGPSNQLSNHSTEHQYIHTTSFWAEYSIHKAQCNTRNVFQSYGAISWCTFVPKPPLYLYLLYLRAHPDAVTGAIYEIQTKMPVSMTNHYKKALHLHFSHNPEWIQSFCNRKMTTIKIGGNWPCQKGLPLQLNLLVGEGTKSE